MYVQVVNFLEWIVSFFAESPNSFLAVFPKDILIVIDSSTDVLIYLQSNISFYMWMIKVGWTWTPSDLQKQHQLLCGLNGFTWCMLLCPLCLIWCVLLCSVCLCPCLHHFICVLFLAVIGLQWGYSMHPQLLLKKKMEFLMFKIDKLYHKNLLPCN